MTEPGRIWLPTQMETLTVDTITVRGFVLVGDLIMNTQAEAGHTDRQ